MSEPPPLKASAPARRLLFVEQFYYPDGWGGTELPLDITVHLARSGFDVEVICGSDQYAPLEGEPPPDPRAHGIRVRRITSLLRGPIHRGKLFRQLWFYLSLTPLLLLRRPPDVFITQTNPPLAVVLMATAARLWRTPLMIIAMDIYPEVLIAHGAAGPDTLAGRLLARAFGWAYRQAQRIVALGPVMRERLQAKGVRPERIVEIPNWATGSPGLVSGPDNSLRAQWDLDGKFVVLYSGNLGLAHEFNTLLRGVREAMASVPSLRLIFIGRGSRLEEVRREVSALGIDPIVRFSDLLPAHRLPESFGITDLAIVTLRPRFAGLVVPSKLQGYMARGLPTLYIGPDSDIERFIRQSGGGICLGCEDVRGVAAALVDLAGSPERRRMLGDRARQFYAERFAPQHGLARYETVVRSVIADTRAMP